MVFALYAAVSFAAILGLYLVIEERERRRANPSAASWRVRMREELKRKGWLLMMSPACLVAFGAIREKDLVETAWSAAIAFWIVAWHTLYEVTHRLRRSQEA
jgi:hypothetical protein